MRAVGRFATAAGVVLLALVGCRVADGSGVGGAEQVDLVGTEWQLVETTLSGRTATVPPDVDSVLRFDGRGGFSAKVCNYIEGAAVVDDDHITLGRALYTEMACHGPDRDVEKAFHTITAGRVGWVIDGNRLRLGDARGDSLVYRVRSSIYPDLTGRAVVAGERDGFQYRLYVDGSGDDIGMGFESRGGPGQPWRWSRMSGPAPGEPTMWSVIAGDVAGEKFVAGFVPAGTIRVTHRSTTAATPVDLPIYRIHGSSLQVFGGFVTAHTRASAIVGYASDGRIVASWH